MCFCSIFASMNDEVLKILNEPDRPYDSPIDMSCYDVDDVLEEEEVEIEYLSFLALSCLDSCSLTNMSEISALEEDVVLPHTLVI